MEWQQIETAPKDGTKVLIVNDEGAMAVAGYVEQWNERIEFVRKAKDGDVYRTVREETGYWDTDTAYCPTHWMPLPEAPNALAQGPGGSSPGPAGATGYAAILERHDGKHATAAHPEKPIRMGWQRSTKGAIGRR